MKTITHHYEKINTPVSLNMKLKYAYFTKLTVKLLKLNFSY